MKTKNKSNAIDVEFTPPKETESLVITQSDEILKRPTCKAGHLWTVQNTRLDKTGSRHCRVCDQIYDSTKRDRSRWNNLRRERSEHLKQMKSQSTENRNLV